MKLISLGTQCSPAAYIKFKRKESGIESPFSRTGTNPRIISNILQDDFKTFLDRDKYSYGTKPRSKKIVPISEDGVRFSHCDPIKKDSDYEKIKAECEYLKECLNTPSGFGYIMSIFYPFKKYENELMEIRSMIPADCKFFVCYFNKKLINIEPDIIFNDIYYGAINVKDLKFEDGLRARSMGMSKEYTKMIDKIFY
tara:strand:- start:221 stop:811 length:591 start_codon:yes stop_codon:yes gene_type:complete